MGARSAFRPTLLLLVSFMVIPLGPLSFKPKVHVTGAIVAIAVAATAVVVLFIRRFDAPDALSATWSEIGFIYAYMNLPAWLEAFLLLYLLVGRYSWLCSVTQ